MNDHQGNYYQATRMLTNATANLEYLVHVFGDTLAKREGYNQHKGIDAVHFYISTKYCWPPSQVRALNTDDLQFLLAEEMHNWTAPKEAVFEDR